ncbi:acetyl-CoA synthetase-like protein [Artomyces pyxidatus]|uniref:Acetyl-CoA synthetase-like protein n=1 Tax=Artomyces pyxidatus TaxID=48021 RepID=A0ACB8TIP1_9AGAM|nr:acetyl-CoA synthetase-like protein [Artomyces pyxidatus]
MSPGALPSFSRLSPISSSIFTGNAFHPTPESIPPPNVNLTLPVPPGLPVNIHPLVDQILAQPSLLFDSHTFQNPLDFLLRGAQIYPDKLALVHPDVPQPVFYTYAVWAQRVQNFAYALLKSGIQPGDTIAVIAPNSPMIADAMQGVIGARAIITTINTRLTKSEVDYILQHSGAKLLFVDHEYAHLVKDAKIPVIISQDTGRPGDPYEEFLSAGRKFSRERGWQGLEMDADENKAVCLNYTSGTTGRPKGVLTTLRGTYLAAIANAFEAQMDKNSTYLWILPMFHAAGWTFPWSATFAFSTQITLRTVDYTLIWKHLLHSNVTHYCGAPTIQIGVVNHPHAERLNHPVRAIIAGAAPTAHLLSELEKTGITPVHVYGLTYTYGPFTRNYPQPSWAALPLDERAKLSARQGHAFATSYPLRVVYPLADAAPGTPAGTLVDVPKDGKTVGEIVARGNIVMHGYFRDADATSRAFEGGYFHSGDLAVWHPDGSIAIQDRSKDIIISGGENASTLAIEQELASHPDVLEVSVVGRPHPKWGERPMAFVILHAESAKRWAAKHADFARDLKRHAKDRLPGFATPEWIVVVEELPKTSTGKILKTTLRKRAASAKL